MYIYIIIYTHIHTILESFAEHHDLFAKCLPKIKRRNPSWPIESKDVFVFNVFLAYQ